MTELGHKCKKEKHDKCTYRGCNCSCHKQESSKKLVLARLEKIPKDAVLMCAESQGKR